MSQQNGKVGKQRFSLVKLTNQHMTRNRIRLQSNTVHYYPSESSVVWTDQYGIKRVSGTCLRRAYLRVTGLAKPTKPDAYSEWIFALGKAVEIILVEQWKQAGIWVDNNIKFYNSEYNVSGELDCIIQDLENNCLVCTECKSYYGYYAGKEIMGSRDNPPRPKTSHLLQAVIYLYETRSLISYAKLFYAARDADGKNEFDIEIDTEGSSPGKTYILVNGTRERRFTIEDIYTRYRTLDQYVKNQILPPKDFEEIWDARRVEDEYKRGEVSKTAYQKWQRNPKKNPIKSWQCVYCPFTKYCREHS